MIRPLVLLALVACGTAPADPGPLEDTADVVADAPSTVEVHEVYEVHDVPGADPGDVAPADPPPANIFLNQVPCEHPAAFPLRIEAAAFVVHYRTKDDQAEAEAVRDALLDAWEAHTALGFRAPPSDGDLCGPDERFDVFVWPGQESAWVDVLGAAPGSPSTDQIPYMAVDPYSEYGGPLLRPTVFHELDHAFQAADDSCEEGGVYEMGATFIEGRLVPESDAWRFVLDDFQANPGWGLFHYDDYETWYMYGSALFLHFLADTYLASDASFLADAWLGARGEATFTTALDTLVPLREAVLEFAVWRATQDPPPTWTTADIPGDLMLYGSAYVKGQGEVVGPEHPEVEMVVQPVAGGVVVTAVEREGATASPTSPETFEVALDLFGE